MAPATFAGAAPRVRQGRVVWDRDAVINAIREWVATYGEPPRAADWNPSAAKWSGQPWRVERYRAGRADGSPWPALKPAKRPFGGSLTAAIVAAGFQPAKPGPQRRAGGAPAQVHRSARDPDARAVRDTALAQARAAQRRVASLERRMERAQASASTARRERRAARRAQQAGPKVVRERVVDDAALARAGGRRRPRASSTRRPRRTHASAWPRPARRPSGSACTAQRTAISESRWTHVR